MLIEKRYKFYAAHRNETLSDKCRNIHGHRYEIRCMFEVTRDGSISTLFSVFDNQIEPHIKQHYDHAMLIHKHDPLYETLVDHCQRTGESFRFKILNGPTSVENLAHELFTEITEMGFRLAKLVVQETDTSVLEYTREDWVNDNRLFSKSENTVSLA